MATACLKLLKGVMLIQFKTTVLTGSSVIWQGVGWIGGWNRRPWDSWLPADVDGDGQQELVIWNNVDFWTGLLKWMNGALHLVWATASPVTGPQGQWNRRKDDSFGVVSRNGTQAVSIANPSGGWHCFLVWNGSALAAESISSDWATVPGVLGVSTEDTSSAVKSCEAVGLHFGLDIVDPNYLFVTQQDPQAGTLAIPGSNVVGYVIAPHG